MPNQMEQQPWEAKPVRDKDWINFHCQLCGQCCRNLKDAVMVESLDAYRITRHLRGHGRPGMEMCDFFDEYTDAQLLEVDGAALRIRLRGPLSGLSAGGAVLVYVSDTAPVSPWGKLRQLSSYLALIPAAVKGGYDVKNHT